jgi:hypothetical protein
MLLVHDLWLFRRIRISTTPLSMLRRAAFLRHLSSRPHDAFQCSSKVFIRGDGWRTSPRITNNFTLDIKILFLYKIPLLMTKAFRCGCYSISSLTFVHCTQEEGVHFRLQHLWKMTCAVRGARQPGKRNLWYAILVCSLHGGGIQHTGVSRTLLPLMKHSNKYNTLVSYM